MTLLLLTTSHEKQVNLSSSVSFLFGVSPQLSNGAVRASSGIGNSALVAATLVASSDPVASIVLTSVSVTASASNGAKRAISAVSGSVQLISLIYQGTRRGLLNVECTSSVSASFPKRQYGAVPTLSSSGRYGSGGTPTAAGGRS